MRQAVNEADAKIVVTVVECRGMVAAAVKRHLASVRAEISRAGESGRVCLLIDALDPNFHDLEARKVWSQGVCGISPDSSVHGTAFGAG